MTSLILVTGGTGTLGRQVAARLRDAPGGKVRVLSRHGHPPGDGVEFVAGDLLAGEGKSGPRWTGPGPIVQCASGNKGDAEATRNLVCGAASSLPEAPHLVYISIVGSDLVSFGYVRAKLECERIVAGVRVAVDDASRDPVLRPDLQGCPHAGEAAGGAGPRPGFAIQPVDSGEVAARLADLALGGPGRAGCPTWAGRRCSASRTCCMLTCG